MNLPGNPAGAVNWSSDTASRLPAQSTLHGLPTDLRQGPTLVPGILLMILPSLQSLRKPPFSLSW